MGRIVLGIVLILLFVAGLGGNPPSMPAYLAGGGALFLLPGILCVVFGVRRVRRGPAQAPLAPSGQPAAAAAQPPAPDAPPAAWYPDPTDRHQQRFWDGARWTHNVADDGSVSTEPPDVRELIGVLGEGSARRSRTSPVSDFSAQVEAARTLGELGDSRAVRPLLDVALASTQPSELREAALAALATLGKEAEIIKVTDFGEIASYGIMRTPGLVVDEEVVLSGRVAKPAEIAELLAHHPLIHRTASDTTQGEAS